jgi:hypothetical protein
MLLLPASTGLSWAASGPGSSADQRAPAGLVILARARTPQGVVEIGLRHVRFLGKVSLCLIEADHTDFRLVAPETCASYPVGPSSGQGIDHTHLLLGSIFSGLCSRKQFLLYAAVVLRRGLTAWLQSTDLREVPMHAVAVPKAFNVSGPLVYAVVRIWQPYAILLRDAMGKTVSEVRVLKLGAGFCKS